MENIYATLERLDFLDEIRENERKEAAKRLQNDLCVFIAHYGQVYKSKEGSYSFIRNGGEVELGNLSNEEMEILHDFMVDTLNNDLQYLADEIDRYIDLC